MEQATCRLCGETFQPKQRRDGRGGRLATCCDSIECKRAYYRAAASKHRDKVRAATPDRRCGECGAAFRRSGNRRYCSPECGKAAHLRTRRERECNAPARLAPVRLCQRCGNEIETFELERETGSLRLSKKRRYCSADCREAAKGEAERFRLKGIDPATARAIRCALCDAADQRLVIDHDHDCCPGQRACGKCFRGMLCHSCNVAIGMLRESPTLLRRAARYIETARRKRSQGGQMGLFPPMTTQSVPHMRRSTVAEQAKKTSSDKPVEKPVEPPKLARASESGDAGVQNLLAQRNGYDVNGMTDKVAEVDRQLAELGYTVQ